MEQGLKKRFKSLNKTFFGQKPANDSEKDCSAIERLEKGQSVVVNLNNQCLCLFARCSYATMDNFCNFPQACYTRNGNDNKKEFPFKVFIDYKRNTVTRLE